MTIRSMPTNDAYRENFDRAFGKKSCAVCAGRNHPTTVAGERLESCPVCGRRFDVKPEEKP